MFEPSSLLQIPDEFNLFNLEPNEYSEMFEKAPPKSLNVSIALFHTDPGDEESSITILDAQRDKLADIIEKVVHPCKILVEFGVPLLPLGLSDKMQKNLRDWMVGGHYLQCAYWDDNDCDAVRPQFGISVAKTWLDSEVDYSHSIEPNDHSRISCEPDPETIFDWDIEIRGLIPPVFSKGFKVAVGQIYSEGVGVWNRALVDPRNEILVKCGAVLRGLDPDREYEKFLKSGESYFLFHKFGR